MTPLKPLIGGSVDAPVLVLNAPISFWGGVDHETGRITDKSHPQLGVLVGGACMVVPNIRGSGGTPGNLADTLRRGCGHRDRLSRRQRHDRHRRREQTLRHVLSHVPGRRRAAHGVRDGHARDDRGRGRGDILLMPILVSRFWSRATPTRPRSC
ncbi:MAG: DUF126 domain-containing protein [Rhodospirillales bacterium]|nr:DUF126 domain-containing protein [Rhodospirillales bacterium]